MRNIVRIGFMGTTGLAVIFMPVIVSLAAAAKMPARLLGIACGDDHRRLPAPDVLQHNSESSCLRYRVPKNAGFSEGRICALLGCGHYFQPLRHDLLALAGIVLEHHLWLRRTSSDTGGKGRFCVDLRGWRPPCD